MWSMRGLGRSGAHHVRKKSASARRQSSSSPVTIGRHGAGRCASAAGRVGDGRGSADSPTSSPSHSAPPRVPAAIVPSSAIASAVIPAWSWIVSMATGEVGTSSSRAAPNIATRWPVGATSPPSRISYSLRSLRASSSACAAPRDRSHHATSDFAIVTTTSPTHAKPVTQVSCAASWPIGAASAPKIRTSPLMSPAQIVAPSGA